MIDQTKLRALSGRLTSVRAGLLSDYPFFGRLLLHLQIGFAECATAFTDMKRIVFDPRFAERLGDDELRFVFLHETLHCVLHHCTRGRSLRPYLYNVACDIVVNSLILETLNQKEFRVDGADVMHLAPDGSEGREHSAEEVYEMLLSADPGEIREPYGGGGLDIHSVWERIPEGVSDDEWEQYVREAAGKAGTGVGSGIPYGLKRYLSEISHAPKTNWRQLLHDFIRHDRGDFVYSIPDRRFQGDFIMPSFQECVYGEQVDKLWFLIDTSGSISDETLAEAFGEIRGAIDQIEGLSGELSFFDTKVSEPQPFESVEELSDIEPVGGGGTSFRAIFAYMAEHYDEELPRAVLILTDGYADFPEESAAMDVPVMWILIDSPIDPPWGEIIHIGSE